MTPFYVLPIVTAPWRLFRSFKIKIYYLGDDEGRGERSVVATESWTEDGQWSIRFLVQDLCDSDYDLSLDGIHSDRPIYTQCRPSRSGLNSMSIFY